MQISVDQTKSVPRAGCRLDVLRAGSHLSRPLLAPLPWFCHLPRETRRLPGRLSPPWSVHWTGKTWTRWDFASGRVDRNRSTLIVMDRLSTHMLLYMFSRVFSRFFPPPTLLKHTGSCQTLKPHHQTIMTLLFFLYLFILLTI